MTFSLFNTRVQIFIIVVSCILLYGNTIRNTYALDDEVVIQRNLNVQKGTAGLKKIFTTDAFQGYLDMMDAVSPVSGGRYRPLSIATFAIEQEMFGETYGSDYYEAQKIIAAQQRENTASDELTKSIQQKNDIQGKIFENNLLIAPQRHLIQILLFALSMVALLFFVNHFVFPSYPLVGFFTVLLFVFHPVHTEVVANLKSRDEIMSLLFIALTGIYFLKYSQDSTRKNLVLCLLCFVGALLSKEYAMVFPFILAAGMWIIHKYEPKKIFNAGMKGMLAILFLFVCVRFSLFNNIANGKTHDVLNEPYLFASTSEKLASRISIILQYFRVLIYPKNLSYDYSYNHLPYLNFSQWQVWLSIFLYIGLFALTFILLKKRHIMAFALIFFLSFFMLVNNLFFNIGATMGERLIYHSSLGFCMAVVWFIYFLIEQTKANTTIRKLVIATICTGIALPFSAKTISRNRAWQNDYTLNTADVLTVPESALANSNAGSEIFNNAVELWLKDNDKTAQDSALFKKSIDTAIVYFKKSIAIHPTYFNSYTNLGLCYYNLNDFPAAAMYWEKAAHIFNGPHPTLQTHSRLFLTRGRNYGAAREFDKASIELLRASKIYPYDADIWYNLGGALFMTGKFKGSVQAFSKSLELNPNLREAQQGKQVAENFYALREKTQKDSTNAAVWLEAGGIYKQNNMPGLAKDAYLHALKLGDSRARKELNAIKK